MSIRAIATNVDYHAALKEIESLLAASANTIEGDRLDALANLIEACERIHFPISPE